MRILLVSIFLLPIAFSRFVDNNSSKMPKPPPFWEKAKMARYVLHISDWGSIATISSQPQIRGLPYANVLSTADGIMGSNSTGTPYFFMSSWDVSSHDLEKFPAATFVVTMAQSDICRKSGLDPESPVCARVMLTGNLVKLNETEEIAEVKNYLFTRHPAMKGWPADHGWFFAKLDLKFIQMLDFYGGISTIKVEEYYKVKVY